MEYFPIFADLRDREVVVVGQSAMAAEKARVLSGAGAEVRRLDQFDPEAVAGAFLIVADVGPDEAIRIQEFGREHRIFVNIVDKPAFCSFIFPAIMERGDLLVAVSTQGHSPALAGWIREKLFGTLGPEYAAALRVLGGTRQEIRNILGGYEDRREFYRGLFEQGFVERLAELEEWAARREIVDQAKEFARCRLSAAEPAASIW